LVARSLGNTGENLGVSADKKDQESYLQEVQREKPTN
jgi:hypothetical protein